MGKEHFNSHIFSRAMDMKKEDVYLSIELFRQYLEEFPDDYMALANYAILLITIRKLDEAKVVLEEIDLKRALDKNITKYKEKNLKNDASIYFVKAKLLMYSEKYQEAYDILNREYKLLTDNGYFVNGTILYCQKKISGDNFKILDGYPYLYKQINKYSTARFYNHIQKHLAGYNGPEETRAVFTEDFKFEKVMEYINNNIPSDKCLYTGLIDDCYYFKYDSCGKVDNKYTDYFKLVALHNTNNFITLTPSDVGKNLPYIDLNYLNDDYENTSNSDRIDKFNKKYAKYLIKK